MNACVLYSGGKDSSLMAVILERLGYKVQLVTVNFGIFDSWKPAAESASHLGFRHHVLTAPSTILEDAVQIVIADGFPNHGINYIHRKSLDMVSSTCDVVADGTRRDDRTPKLQEEEIRSFEDRKDVEYINLQGFGHNTIYYLSGRIFNIKKEPTNMENNSDYEIEMRYLIEQMKGNNASSSFFPEHMQSRVMGWNGNVNKFNL